MNECEPNISSKQMSFKIPYDIMEQNAKEKIHV